MASTDGEESGDKPRLRHLSGGGGEDLGVHFAAPLTSKDAKSQQLGHQLRLRRVRSTSRAEEIVTEEEKQRRAQPDKP